MTAATSGKMPGIRALREKFNGSVMTVLLNRLAFAWMTSELPVIQENREYPLVNGEFLVDVAHFEQ